MTTSRRGFLASVGPAAASAAVPQQGAEVASAAVSDHTELLRRSFVHGREYFVLRSGRAKLIVQADQVDLGPAFLWLAFDARNNKQTARKQNAYNFANERSFLRSALEVVLGGFAFTALGHSTETRWVVVDGVPAVEARWWAGGLLVTEHLLALDRGTFLRRITLASRNLGGTEQVSFRLRLPQAPAEVQDQWLISKLDGVRFGLGLTGSSLARINAEESSLTGGPYTIEPGQAIVADTLLSVEPAPFGATAPESFTNVKAAIDATRASWTRTSSIATSDSVIRDIYDKARFGLHAMVADNGVMDAGIFEYGAQWVRDTSNTLLGLIHTGDFEVAREGFTYMLRNMVKTDGNMMIGNLFESPDREQFDQMGELMSALKAYRDWTGDDSLIRENRQVLIPLIERPLRPEFRHSTGMVHNRREFWERTFGDAMELAYQTYVILGLRASADLAESLDAVGRANVWRGEADRIQRAMLTDPTFALVEQQRLIKRRSVDGQWVKKVTFPAHAPDVPTKTETTNLAEPDATMALPIAFGIVDPRSELARNTLEELEGLWNARWFFGGYERYHSSSQCDQPGPWTFASCFILRALHEAGLHERSRRTLEWLNSVQGGRTGAWFEEIPLVRSQAPTAGIIPWTSGEISLFIVRHLLGVRFEGSSLVVRPALYPGSAGVRANLRFRGERLMLEIPRAGRFASARVNGGEVRLDAEGALRLRAAEFAGGSVVFVD